MTPAEAAQRLKALSESWKDVSANERASFQTWFLQFCDALGVPAPAPPTDDYRFELPVRVVDRDGELATNFIDAWHAGHFAMEAKMSDRSKSDDTLLRRAFGQVRTYVSHVSGTPPPYLMVVDVPRTLMIWDRWSGSYGDFGAGRRIALGSLHERVEDIALLQDVFARPAARDPRGRAQVVTKEIAAKLAALSAALEGRGLDQERVARFLMRCVFSCFAEDVGLLPAQLFRKTLEAARASGEATRLTAALELLWKTMDEGGMFGAEMLHRFNGHFFKTREALPLEPVDVTLLIEATSYDWSRVEPSIFGTLLVRALDPAERHRLGAEYTPREYIERLVEPTVVEPIREKWVAVQATVLQLEETPKKRDAAIKQLLEFHSWMRSLRFLDPACGSGNFLYVTMAAVKRIEYEVLNEIQRVSGGQGGLVLDEVHPRQFYGIEIKPWAREIAELTLWIGYHQFWRETHGGRTPPDPILEDTGTIECRDAILAYDDVVHRPEKDRPDPTPRIVSPVTGELVPDPAAKLPYYEYVNARPAEWPKADFIVGNPPYLGEKRQRDALGDGYVDALRATYSSRVSASADLVMYWWVRAAEVVGTHATSRAGLITTNSVTQEKNRTHIADARRNGVRIIWAVSDHPWVDGLDGAAVRVALSVMTAVQVPARRVVVDENALVVREETGVALNDNLSFGADVINAASTALLSNRGLCHQGFKIGGAGFRYTAAEAGRLLELDTRHVGKVRRLVTGRDLATNRSSEWVIDLGLADETTAREAPLLFDLLRGKVYPERQASSREAYRNMWWRFQEPRREMREALASLPHMFATLEVSRHRYFVRLPSQDAPDGTLVVIATDAGWILGVLSSSIHNCWALAAGSRLGVGNDARYNKGVCFDSFPFPYASHELLDRVACGVEALDRHRSGVLGASADVSLTKIYNIIEKLRTETPLTPAERTINELAACGVLRDLHDELDRLVAQAYGWPWPMEKGEILERLVALHDERVEEEKRGLVRWLRPEYQIPRFAPEQANAELALPQPEQAVPTRGKKKPKASAAESAPKSAKPAWPGTAVEQISAITALIGQQPLDAGGVANAFSGAKLELVQRHLETLALMGEAAQRKDGRFAIARRVA
jgi:hypothetical protein